MVPLADQLLYSRLTSNSSLLYSPGIDTRRKSIAEVASYSNYFSVSTALEISLHGSSTPSINGALI